MLLNKYINFKISSFRVNFLKNKHFSIKIREKRPFWFYKHKKIIKIDKKVSPYVIFFLNKNRHLNFFIDITIKKFNIIKNYPKSIAFRDPPRLLRQISTAGNF